MGELKRFTIWCETEEAAVKTPWQTTPPTQCPNDAGHTVTAGSQVIVAEDFSPARIAFALQNSGNPYTECGATSYEEIFVFIYPGAIGTGRPEYAKIVIATNDDDPDTCKVRIRQVWPTPEVTIVEQTSLSIGARAIKDLGTLSNLPMEPAIFSLQVAKNAPSSANVLVWFLSMYNDE